MWDDDSSRMVGARHLTANLLGEETPSEAVLAAATAANAIIQGANKQPVLNLNGNVVTLAAAQWVQVFLFAKHLQLAYTVM